MKVKQYPYRVQVIKYESVLMKYCKVSLWSKWNARITYYGETIAIYLQHPNAPVGEVRVKDHEIKFLNGLPPTRDINQTR